MLAEEVIPCFGVLECSLSDRGTNLLSNLMIDLCKMLGVTKLRLTTLNVMEPWSASITHWRRAWGSMQHDSAANGTISYLGYCGLIGTRHTHQLERSRPSYCMVLTVGPLRRQRTYLFQMFTLQMLATTEKNWCSHSLLLENWQQPASRLPKPDTNMITMPRKPT